ncbi:hypothetical protein ACFPRL_03430 [Pseudoclavibacter helvolus]
MVCSTSAAASFAKAAAGSTSTARSSAKSYRLVSSRGLLGASTQRWSSSGSDDDHLALFAKQPGVSPCSAGQPRHR